LETVPPTEDVSEVDDSYGSVRRSMFTLFKSITNGEDWGRQVEVLLNISFLCGALFLGFIAFCTLALMNLITGFFVDVAMQEANQEREIVTEAQLRQEEASAEHLREVFVEMSDDDLGIVGVDTFRDCMKDERVKSFLQALKINVTDADLLFTMLDVDSSGEVVIDEFVDGCMKLKGEAKSMDMHILLCEIRHAIGHWQFWMDSTSQKLGELSPTELHGGRRGAVDAAIAAPRESAAPPKAPRLPDANPPTMDGNMALPVFPRNDEVDLVEPFLDVLPGCLSTSSVN
jgi:hypothetical protein